MSRTATYVQQGERIDYTPASSSIAAGTPVKLANGLYGIADRDIAEGETGAITIKGVYSFVAGGTISVGAPVYLSNGTVTDTPVDGACVGVAIGAAASSGCEVPVLLNTVPNGAVVKTITAPAGSSSVADLIGALTSAGIFKAGE
ncbi:MAG: DUF2190 family protein [Victivallales bacterium]|nr:DUF2190 family protein [Victivallales bacterium]